MDIKFANELGYTIKLLGIIKKANVDASKQAKRRRQCRFRFIRLWFRIRTCWPA